jgi:hypothetical protein
MSPGRQYIIKLATRSVSGSISSINYRIDVNTLEHHDTNELQLNEIASCTVSVNAPVVFDPYKQNKGTGAFIIIDRLSNVTVGAGMITGESGSEDLVNVSADERAARFSQKASTINLTGSSSQEVAYQLERKLFDTGHAATVLENQSADNSLLIPVIKNAGLICISIVSQSDLTDLSFDCEKQSIEEIYAELKLQKIIY